MQGTKQSGDSWFPRLNLEEGKEDEERTYREIRVDFTLPGPPNTFSSVRVGASVGRTCRKSEIDDLYAEAKEICMREIEDATASLALLAEQILRQNNRLR